jgi:hypothetical protein
MWSSLTIQWNNKFDGASYKQIGTRILETQMLYNVFEPQKNKISW